MMANVSNVRMSLLRASSVGLPDPFCSVSLRHVSEAGKFYNFPVRFLEKLLE
jgi:hypothetical protein